MTQFAYFEGTIRPIEEARISVMTHAFNYGTGWFGGLRGYWNAEQEQLYVFRIRDHYRRFLNSGKILMANLDPREDDWCNHARTAAAEGSAKTATFARGLQGRRSDRRTAARPPRRGDHLQLPLGVTCRPKKVPKSASAVGGAWTTT